MRTAMAVAVMAGAPDLTLVVIRGRVAAAVVVAAIVIAAQLALPDWPVLVAAAVLPVSTAVIVASAVAVALGVAALLLARRSGHLAAKGNVGNLLVRDS